ncbi:hypothetical protein HHL11_09415 [Ramlibacter sp. G-1-2-2]|uniref:Uncharacterized protein n=1 Tax=Ramlibacter agri TaxID=2728837 RepID=A0A848GZ38_9BURK|nr:hypothetical protein [Ramlibacter agri]NML43966.1 hypothetical protein [Ramlibacter agri]
MPKRELHVKAVALSGGAIALSVLLAVGAVFLLLRHWRLPPSGADWPTPPTVSGPALQSAPQLDLVAYRAEKQAWLDGAGWVDPGQGIAHIPIADAMDLLVQRSAAAPKRGARR